MKPSDSTPRPASTEQEAEKPTPVIVVLSGRERGSTKRLSGDRIHIGTALGDDIRFVDGDSLRVLPHHVMLERRGSDYEIHAAPGADVWVNGVRTDRGVLESGDVLEIGEGGPVLRFRVYPPGSSAWKSVREAFSDCVGCARHHGRSAIGRAAILLARTPQEFATQISPWVRGGAFVILALAVLTSVFLEYRNRQLQERLEEQSEAINDILERAEAAVLTAQDLSQVRADIEQRLDALEAQGEASARVIAVATRSVIFIQGAYGFVDPESGRPLRFVSPERPPVPGVHRPVSLDGEGPPVEVLYTGTAFAVGDGDLFVTNRHVALPWEADASSRRVSVQGLRPVVRQLIGYLPGAAESVRVGLVRVSDEVDLAVLACGEASCVLPPLPLVEEPPLPGDEIIVLGFPAGMRALLARADKAFVDDLQQAAERDFWTVARRLAENGHMTPLATRGIVGQVTESTVVYDAETTRGGSGGPVLDLDGHVVAVNTAVLAEFGGSNLGVPVARIPEMLLPEVEPREE